MIYRPECCWNPIDQACSRGPRKAERDRGPELGARKQRKNPPMIKCFAMHRKSNSNIRAHSWHSTIAPRTSFHFPFSMPLSLQRPAWIIYSLYQLPPSLVKAFLSKHSKSYISIGIALTISLKLQFSGFRKLLQRDAEEKRESWLPLTVQEKSNI